MENPLIENMVKELGDVSATAQYLSSVVERVIRRLVLFNLQNHASTEDREESDAEQTENPN